MKRWLGLLCMIAVTLTLCGCAPLYNALDELVGDDQVAAVEAVPHIAFSDEDVTDPDVITTVEEFKNYPVTYTAYHSSLLYDTLTADEQLVYRAFEYALENGFPSILIDKATFSDLDRLNDILTLFALSSPLVEQNLRYDAGEFTLYYPITVLDLYEREAEFSGIYITVYNFEPQWWEQKLLAIDKAEAIIQSFPDNLSEAAMAEKIYRYVGAYVEYVNYDATDGMEVYPYLTDALINGKTHCDGYTNALALLFRTAGIECVEKQHTTNDIDEVGHTWNCIRIGNEWYNVDGTLNSMIPTQECSMGAGMGFAYSDKLHASSTDYAKLYPQCTFDLHMPIDAHLISLSDEAFVDQAVAAFIRHDYEWAYILIEEYNEADVESRMQAVVNRIGGSFSYMIIDVMNDRHKVFLYNSDLLDP